MENDLSGKGAVFFDRDGTLNVDTGYLYRIEEFRWIEGAVDAIRYCNEKGWPVIVVTNQSGVARGFYPEEAVGKLHLWMQEELKKQGAHIDAFYYCPHHPEGIVPGYAGECSCRKPAPGLVERACREHGIHAGASILIGDKEQDMECARRAGMRGIRFLGGNLLETLRRGLIREGFHAPGNFREHHDARRP